MRVNPRVRKVGLQNEKNQQICEKNKNNNNNNNNTSRRIHSVCIGTVRGGRCSGLAAAGTTGTQVQQTMFTSIHLDGRNILSPTITD